MATLTTSYQKIGTGGVKTFGATKARIDLYAKYNSQSIPNNSSNYSIEARLVITSGSYIGEYDSTTLTLSGNSISSTQSKGTGNFRSQTLGSASGTVTHNANGTKSVSCSASMKFKAWGITLTVSGSADLPTIPRYATINSFTVSKRDETSFTFNWSANATIDYVWYSTNNGSSWTGYDTADGTSGSFTVGSLSANTTYNCKLRVRRKDSQLNTDSSAVSQTTYDYPHATTTPNFVIENAVTISLYNPLSRNCTVTMYGDDWSTIYSGSGWTGTTISPFNTPTIISNLYASIPNKKTGTYHIKVQYGGVARDKTNAGTYTVNETINKPTFTDFNYQDINTNTVNLTGSNQILVDNNSECKFSLSQRAIGVNGASIDSYVCYWGDNYYSTLMEKDMNTYWKKTYENRFTISYDSVSDMNTVACTGAGMYENLYFQIKTIVGRLYTFTFDYRNPNGYTPLHGYDGIPCQILTRVDDGDNIINQITSVILNPTANQETQHLSVTFTATTSITYINFNFGYAVDDATTTIELGNFDLNGVVGAGNVVKVEAIDSRGLSTVVSKTITNVPYKNIVINKFETERKDGVDTKTYLAGKFTIYNGSWDGTDAENSQNRLKYVGYSVYENDTWSQYYDITNAVLTGATTTIEDNNKIYEFDFSDEIQIHANGSSGGFPIGTEYQVKVLVKDGNNSYVFTPLNYEALLNVVVADGTVAYCLHKDSNGVYHLGINGMSDDTWLVSVGGVGIIKERV